MNLQLEKKKIPRGVLTAIAKKVNATYKNIKTSYQVVGSALGVYPPTVIGIGDRKKEIIFKAAKEVAEEKIKEYNEKVEAYSYLLKNLKD
jgi:hypothetical protein